LTLIMALFEFESRLKWLLYVVQSALEALNQEPKLV